MGSQRRTPGDLLANGNTSDVWEWSSTTVVKLLHPMIPEHWATLEADITQRVHAAGLPAPAVEDTVVVNGRPGIVFERIEGVPMWDHMRASPDELSQLVGAFVGLQADLHAAGSVGGLPDLVSRLRTKIGEARDVSAHERDEALHLLARQSVGSALCHGDMHPKNILMSPRGMVVVDWFDAAIGPAAADYVRSSLLMRPSCAGTTARSHLDGASSGLLQRLHREYVVVLAKKRLLDESRFAEWEAVSAVARMAEPVPAADLVSIWRSWRTGLPSAVASSFAQASGGVRGR